ncbi:MAG: hypothetical protein WBM24_08885 [Candidatus Sulfotelmatobacter sp.]
MRAISGWRAVGAALSLIVLSGFGLAQTPASGDAVPAATVTFTLDFPLSDPTHYSIAVDANGHASYECAVKDQEDAEEQPYRTEFNVTAANRQRIFEWAKQAKYFSGKVDSGNRKLASTGDKILSYQDGKQSYTARYNYSGLEPVRQLTTLFQSMEATLDYGRRLAYYHRYQKLALDDELKRMEAQARNNELSEIQSVKPVLQSIIEDNSVINMDRARAKTLIQMENDAAER